MTEAYCVRCTTKREMVDEQKHVKGWVKGRCEKCGCVMFKWVHDE